MKKLIIANWKNNPETLEEAKSLAKACDHEAVVICPPLVFLPFLSPLPLYAHLGTQDIDIPVSELKTLAVQYIILGHSQRRLNLGETDSMVNAKVSDAIKNDLTPILCLGANVDEQFANCTKGLDKQDLQKIVYVYEPLGAISTVKDSKPVVPEVANRVIEHIHELAGPNSTVLYGGTVNKDNAADYAKYQSINGALVGAASLDPENFLQVVKIFENL